MADASSSAPYRRKRRRVVAVWPLLACLCLLLCSPVGATPRPRSYDSHDYYVLQVQPDTDPRSIVDALGTEMVEQVGELADHWLVRTPKPALAARSIDAEDPVLVRYARLKRAVTAAHLGSRAFHPARNAIALEKQIIRKRTKRMLEVVSPRQEAQPAEPAYLAEIARRFSILDPLWPKQWHLANDQMRENAINVTDVWAQGITGKGVTVAVIDDGLDMHSDDLAPNFFAEGSWDYNDHTALPEPRLADDRHGTRCAGEIAAVKNDVCGVGVAYDSRVAGIRILSASISDADEASSLNFGYQENDIYSCSWGPPDDGQQMEGPAPLIEKAFLNGIQNGRGGKGNLFVFASGNGGGVDDQCNFDGYTNSIYSVTVGAIDRKGFHPYYSEACSANMVVTYSSGSGDNIHTTDVGKNVCSDSHGGTSAAAPLAAGILALVLQVRPDLSWRDVQHLCVNTAVQVNPQDPDWSTTHAGRPFNHKYGYGKLDAYRLVEAARTWQLVKPQAWWESSKVTSGEPLTPEGVTSTITVSQKVLDAANLDRLEHVTVMIDVKHGRRGNIEVELESPNGVRSVLARVRRFDEAAVGFENWRFMSVKHWDENPVGQWKVRVLDRQQNNFTGTFNHWSLGLWGEALDSSIAQKYKLPGDDQIILPHPPNEPPHPSSSLSSHAVSKTKTIARPTEHLPDDHAEQAGEAHEVFDDLKASTSAGSGDSSTLAYLQGNQSWLFGIAGAAVLVPAILAAVFFIRRRRQRRLYLFQAVPGEDEHGMSTVRTRALYDAFALEDSEGSEDEGLLSDHGGEKP